MNDTQTIRYARWLLSREGVREDPLSQANLLDFCELMKSCVLNLSKTEMAELPFFRDFSESFRRLRDNIDVATSRDPMSMYRPQHNVALQFHKSPAQIRNFFGGNRISKTTAGNADDYWMVTGQHPYRPNATLPTAAFVIGTNFSKYAVKVFEPKWIEGEADDPLSPIFPRNGKWLYRYDERKHIIYIACRECAEAGRAQRCRHLKSSLILFSDVEGPGVLAGGQYVQGHFDEQIKEEFFAEAKQRIKTVRNSGLIITETPLLGKGWWTYQQVYLLGQKGPPENLVPGTEQQIVSNHNIDQFSAGLCAHAQILADMRTMSPQEIEARIYGRHVSASKYAVFDLKTLSEMRDETSDPKYVGVLRIGAEDKGTKLSTTEQLLREAKEHADIRFVKQPSSMLSVWEKPSRYGQYIIGADVSEGMTKADYSAADVLELSSQGGAIVFKQVAQFHGWINSHDYAIELYKLGAWYNNALLVVESNGPGVETLRFLKDMGCPFIFRELSDVSQAQFMLDATFGVDVNVRTKGTILSVLQGLIRRRKTGEKAITVHSKLSVDELEAYVQTPSASGMTFRMGGEGTTHDDCVMSLALGTFVGTAYPVYNHERARQVMEYTGSRDRDTVDFWAWIANERKERDRQKRQGYV